MVVCIYSLVLVSLFFKLYLKVTGIAPTTLLSYIFIVVLSYWFFEEYRNNNKSREDYISPGEY